MPDRQQQHTHAPEHDRHSSSTVVLVATDGRSQSDSALATARLLLQPADTLRLISVIDPISLGPESMMLFSAELETERRAQLQREIAAQTERVWGVPQVAEMAEGDAARSITRVAREVGASLIVAGLGEHTLTARVFGNETALRLARLSDTPVLAVATSLRHVPRRIVVAIDFSETSLQAAQLAVNMAALGASITLVHVAPADNQLFAWAAVHKRHAQSALDAFLAKLRVPEDKHVQAQLVQGDPATEILAVAANVHADLIATGSHGHGLIARFLIGSVATSIVRGSTCSVLILPQAAAFEFGNTRHETIVARGVTPKRWSALLDDISWQNMGRLAHLEIDDPGIGAQVQVNDRPFRGATFDHHDARVELMFGSSSNARDHLTHTIGHVSAIDVLQDADGEDVALRVRHGKGQTIVRFSST